MGRAGAGTGSFQGTIPGGSNPSGATAGQYLDANFVSHGFVHATDGTIVTFDAPGAGTGGTNAFSISPSGEAMGWYLDSKFTFHGFVRKP
jgi:hypothetical protein